MKKIKPWISILLGTGLATMAAMGSRQKEYPVDISVKGGLKTILNPEYPRDGRFEARLTEEMSCGEEAEPDAATMNKPFYVQVDGRGRVYVMDGGDMHIKVFDGQGRFLRTISRKGQGPGEFGTPAFFSLMADGRVCLLDAGQRRISFFSDDGRYLSGFPLEGFFRALAVDESDRIYLAQWSAEKEVQLSTEFREVPYITKIIRTDDSGKKMTLLVDLLGESMIRKAVGQSTVMAGGLYGIVWNINRKGRLYGGFNETYRLNAYGSDGKIEFTFGREHTFLKNPKYSGQVGQKKTMPAFRTIVIDEEGQLWIELYTDKEIIGYTYDVFSPEGIYLKQVRIDQRIAQFMNGRVYSLLRPDDGFPSVKRFRLDLAKIGDGSLRP